jgi:hypothetical protein
LLEQGVRTRVLPTSHTANEGTCAKWGNTKKRREEEMEMEMVSRWRRHTHKIRNCVIDITRTLTHMGATGFAKLRKSGSAG